MNSLNEQTLNKFKEAFDLFDIDKDGAIQLTELYAIFSLIGVNKTEKELHDMINEQNKLIKYNEYINIISRRLRDSDLQEEERAAFKLFDKNGKGKISIDDMRLVMTSISNKLVGQQITEEEIIHMFKIADKDGDGFLNYEEFNNMMNESTNNII